MCKNNFLATAYMLLQHKLHCIDVVYILTLNCFRSCTHISPLAFMSFIVVIKDWSYWNKCTLMWTKSNCSALCLKLILGCPIICYLHFTRKGIFCKYKACAQEWLPRAMLLSVPASKFWRMWTDIPSKSLSTLERSAFSKSHKK